ncbi:Hypothetical protein I595_687 [Croceitalea dokdonensis DOKDO 023]|uniref:Uncharacterized protein n=1 Tax=Croceitalea dokdonensis DOKDO 023 TaxID=1300341 RepID=A0A0P7AZP8_9FLAO|nr:Hypothetical protein I595_687 [Croceitalea dokdonensis DOKDO 023]
MKILVLDKDSIQNNQHLHGIQGTFAKPKENNLFLPHPSQRNQKSYDYSWLRSFVPHRERNS